MKIAHWFKVIERVIQDPAILPENVYNMDKTKIMLSILGSVKVLVGKDNPRDYKDAGIKRTIVTAIEYININSRLLLPLIIWLASSYRNN